MNKKLDYLLYTGLTTLGGLILYDYYRVRKELAVMQTPISFQYRPADSILINLDTGRIIDHTFEKYGVIYYTSKENRYEGWKNCYLLRHRITLRENYSYSKNEIVYLRNLGDFTYEFNNILLKWCGHFYERRHWLYPQKLAYWRSKVTDNAELDIKNNIFKPRRIGEYSLYESSYILRYDDYGNILYGAAGTAFGINESILQLGANLNQMGKFGIDDPNDTEAIKLGIKIYNERYKKAFDIFNSKLIGKVA